MGLKVLEVSAGTLEWALDLTKFLSTQEPSREKEEAKKVRNKMAWITLVDRVLYMWGFSIVLLRCISK